MGCRGLRSPGLTRAAIAALLVLVALGAGRGLRAGEEPSEIERLRELERAVIDVIQKASPAFVFIQGGSGFVISEDGYVLTNEHVVGGAERVIVTLAGGRVFEAVAVGHDPRGDIALLRLEGASGLPYLELGDSDLLEVGQWVVALGDPFLLASSNLFFAGLPPSAYEPSASLGVVSALHRYSDTYSDAIQVDVAVNRGNSGGPLLTLEGKVVGINGKIETRFDLGLNTGAGYAVPSNQIRRFLDHLKKAGGGVVLHGTLAGVRAGERAGDLPGLPIIEVEEDSPAYAAGLRSGDLLMELAGQPVRTRTRLLGIVSTYPAGSSVPAKVFRDGKELALEIPLVARRGSFRTFLGVRTRLPAPPKRGAEIEEVVGGTPADRAGLRAGDIILSVDGDTVNSPTDLARLIRSRPPGTEVRLEVEREGKKMEIRVRLGARPEAGERR